MTETKKWFSDCYRRNLVDMHIEDWSDEFLSKFSPETYVDNLKRAHIEAPMLYLQSHVGHCYWPTKTGHMHAAFKGRADMMRRLVALCRAEGMHPVGYYSLIYNTREEDNHPEWRIVTGADGTSIHQRGGRYGHCCPNNPEYREFLKAQIDEMAEYFYADESARVDGMFYDMTFWPGLCSCPHCKALYKAVTGRDEYPAGNWASPEWRGLVDLRVKQMGEFARFITDYTKEKMPGVSVEHNYASAVASASVECGSTELVNDACDYTGGDLYGDLYNHSFTAKYYYGVTKNQPFEYMTCRCDHSLYAHTITKKEESLSVEVMLTAAHHGASFIIDAIDPVGTLDSRVYDRIGRVFERQIPYEPYFRGEMRQDVGVYYATTGRFNSRNLPFNSKTCSINAVRTLIEANIPVGVAANSTTDRLHRYKTVLAPAIAGISYKNRADLLEYVENGGLLYFSGVEEPALVETLLGARFIGYTPEAAVYLAPTEAGQPFFGEFNTDYPMPSDYSLPIIEGGDYEVLATMKLPYTKAGERRFASIHSNPPGVLTDIPAVVTRTIGKGRVIWSAAPIENDNRRAHRELLLSLLSAYMSPPVCCPTPPARWNWSHSKVRTSFSSARSICSAPMNCCLCAPSP
ncbi:MAG: hypothetical protein IJ493_11345 [Clostridia bacterium]|nr:hypothetical protein [Clostridia bacterium]